MGRGGGGSGRSSGGGGFSSSRSSGGRSHSSSSFRGGGPSRGGFSSSPSRSYRPSSPGPGPRPAFGGSYHRAPPPPPPPGSRRHYYGGPRRSGCLSSALVIILIVIILMFILPIFTLSMTGAAISSSNSITKSTIEREPLDAQYVTTTNWYTDELGWIQSDTKLESGMKQFYKETGVQPYLYITDTVNGTTNPSEGDMDIYANELYDELFKDEGHILLLFYEHNSDSNYMTWYVCGAMAKTVMDQEACDILLDYVDHYYFSDLSEDEMFSTAFEKAGDRIMTVTKSPLPMIIVAIIVLVIVVTAFHWWKRAKAQKNAEAVQTERILNADIGQISEDPTLKDLENKYSK